MKILAVGVILYFAFTHYPAVAGVSVGLYAPDRYDGIPEMCLMPMDFGYCRAKVKRYYFDIRRMKCTMFYWGGCAGNINNFKSPDECNKLCLDAFEADRGGAVISPSRERPTHYTSRNSNTLNNSTNNNINGSIAKSYNNSNTFKSSKINSKDISSITSYDRNN